MRDFDLEFTESRSLGATWALDVLWNRLGIGETMRRVLADRHLDESAERVLFALVANRALAPSPKLTARWVSEDVIIGGLPATSDDACHQAIDWLPEIKDALESEIFERVTHVPDQEVDLLVFNTASYFETDPPRVVGVAITRSGIPLRAWSWSGNISDSALVRQVRDDMATAAPARITWVCKPPFAAEDSRLDLRVDGRNEYIIGAKLRFGSAEAEAALAEAQSREDRGQEVSANLRVMEIQMSSDERFVLCHDPEAAERDAAIRARMLAHIEELIRDTDTLSSDMRAEKLRGFTVARHGRHRYLRVTGSGQFRIDMNAVRAEEQFDGKYLLCTSDTAMSAKDIALRYRQLLDVERGWRSMQQVIDPRPGDRTRREPPAPTSCCAGSPSCWPASPRTLATTAGRSCARNSTESPPAPSAARQVPSGCAPRSPAPARHPHQARHRPAAQDKSVRSRRPATRDGARAVAYGI